MFRSLVYVYSKLLKLTGGNMKKLYVVIVAVLAHLMFISSVSAQPTNSSQLSDPRVRQALCMAIASVFIEGQWRKYEAPNKP